MIEVGSNDLSTKPVGGGRGGIERLKTPRCLVLQRLSLAEISVDLKGQLVI